MKRFVLFFAWIGCSSHASAQRPVVDSGMTLEVGHWPSVRFYTISNDGNYVLYKIQNVPVGSSTLVVQSTHNGWKREFPGLGTGLFTADSKRMIFAEGRDSVCLLSLGTSEETWLPHSNSYNLVGEGTNEWLIFRTTRQGELVIRNIASGKQRRWTDVKDYILNKVGTVLVLNRQDTTDGGHVQQLRWEDLLTEKGKIIWTGEKAFQYTFDDRGRQLAFLVDASKKQGSHPGLSLCYYHEDMDSARIQVTAASEEVADHLLISGEAPRFSHDSTHIFFQLTEPPLPTPPADAVKVDIWHYKDLQLQSSQVIDLRPRLYWAMVDTRTSRVIRLQQEGEGLLWPTDGPGEQVITYTQKGNWTDSWWNPAMYPTLYCISVHDGSRKMLKEHANDPPNPILFSFSPEGRWIVYYDRSKGVWCSYSNSTGVTRIITKNIPYPVYDENTREYSRSYRYWKPVPVGLAGWLAGDRAVLLYDDYDIWEVDPTGEKNPVNVTGGYGRRNHLKFRVAEETNTNKERLFARGDTLLLCAFNTMTKYNGFYRKVLSAAGNPERLHMGPEVIYAAYSQLFDGASPPFGTVLAKARDAAIWVVRRRSTRQAPDLYTTSDFKTFQRLSHCQPQEACNWLTAELLHWTTTEGKPTSGILYKPENFDPKQKYPVIVYYYEQYSDNLYDYPVPSLSYGPLNIPFFVSRGYLVLVPDISYTIGSPGESVVGTVVSGARYLNCFPYVDGKHIGIQGHSFGGFETNYLVTHTHLFAAAAEAAGEADLISAYEDLRYGYGGLGSSAQEYHETGQGRMGATLWEQPDAYIRNSPVLRADRVTTPLLMIHNKKDGNVPFRQAIEFFTALRRLGKRVWLLQYDESSHVMVPAKDTRDYTIRLTQFFDHYLKGMPAPEWMTEGIPARLKGIRTGYELDRNNKEP